MDEDQIYESIYNEARNGNVDSALDELQKTVDQLRKANKLREVLQVLLTTSSILLERNVVDEAANLANLALKISIGQSNEFTLPLLKEFAISYPIENQSTSMINFYLTLIRISGDQNQILRKKLISFAEFNFKQRPDFIQKMYLKLYKECFQANTTSQIIKSYSENSVLEAKEELKQISLNNAVPLHFARFLWSISKNNFENDTSTEKSLLIKSWKHTVNAIFLRAILIVSLQSGSREKSSLASRTLYESILLSKPDDIDISILDHPLYRFGNLITKLMVNFKSITNDSFKNVVDAYEKMLFQDSEIAILLSLISQKYLNQK